MSEEAKPTMMEFILECARHEELVKEFDRLRGTNLSFRGTGLDLAIDKATGRLDSDLQLFVEFCVDMYDRKWVQ